MAMIVSDGFRVVGLAVLRVRLCSDMTTPFVAEASRSDSLYLQKVKPVPVANCKSGQILL